MGLKIVPSWILNKIDPKDRPTGSGGWTYEEAQRRGARREEIPQQKQFAAWLNLRNILFYNPRSDKRSTIRAGASDFTVFSHGKTLFIEFKAPGATQSQDQIEFEIEVGRSGYTYHLVYSSKEAIELCRKVFEL